MTLIPIKAAINNYSFKTKQSKNFEMRVICFRSSLRQMKREEELEFEKIIKMLSKWKTW